MLLGQARYVSLSEIRVINRYWSSRRCCLSALDLVLGGVWVRAPSLAYSFLHKRRDPCLFRSSQSLQCVCVRPHVAFVEVGLVAEAKRRVPRLELRRCLEVAYDLVVLGIRGHPVPESRREGWRAFSDDSMEPCGHGAIRFPHLGYLRQHDALPLHLASLHLLDAVPYRATFLFSECLGVLAGRGGALRGLLRALLRRFHGIRFIFRA